MNKELEVYQTPPLPIDSFWRTRLPPEVKHRTSDLTRGTLRASALRNPEADAVSGACGISSNSKANFTDAT